MRPVVFISTEVSMRRTLLHIALLAVGIAFGFAVGKAQTPQPDFELVVTAPPGETKVECRRGCELVWVDVHVRMLRNRCGAVLIGSNRRLGQEVGDGA